MTEPARLALAVFDMAGTTVRDTGVVPEAFSAALAAFGLSASPERLEAVRGVSKRDAIGRLVRDQSAGGPDDDATADAVYAAFRAELARAFGAGGVSAVPGAQPLFAWLRTRGVKVALNTGFDRETQALVLDALGWRSGVVDAIVCGDDVALGRPAPYMIFRAMELSHTAAVASVLNVGDTTVDLEAGFNAGCSLNVGVCTGAHPRERLLGAPHTHLVESVADLPTLLVSLGLTRG